MKLTLRKLEGWGYRMVHNPNFNRFFEYTHRLNDEL